jgi:hypothetical protein
MMDKAAHAEPDALVAQHAVVVGAAMDDGVAHPPQHRLAGDGTPCPRGREAGDPAHRSAHQREQGAHLVRVHRA